MRLSIHLFQRSLWDLFNRLDNLQTLAIVNLALLKKNTHTVDPDVVYCRKIGAYETNPRFKELRF